MSSLCETWSLDEIVRSMEACWARCWKCIDSFITKAVHNVVSVLWIVVNGCAVAVTILFHRKLTATKFLKSFVVW
jgi:hypothetical protein